MSILGTGIDLVKISDLRTRIEKNPALIKYTFTVKEIEWCNAYFDPGERYAARFAAKEAFYKALPHWIQDKVDWLDIAILPGANGRPEIHSSDRCQVYLDELGISKIFVSISHESDYAIANIILIGH